MTFHVAWLLWMQLHRAPCQMLMCCAALAYLCSGEPGEATSEAINAGHKLLAATFVYGSSHAFDQIIYTGALCPCAHAVHLACLLIQVGDALAFSTSVLHTFPHNCGIVPTCADHVFASWSVVPKAAHYLVH